MKKFIKLPYKLLIYDIETNLLLAYIFNLGEQVVRHHQLLSAFNEFSIICITAKWYGEKELYTFVGEDAVKKFDALAKKADICLGKNSDRFDVKHVNTARMMQGLRPYPEWLDTSDDLEKQCRKYFAFPSQSLDYLSTILGNGGKLKMDFQDWIDIKNYDILKILFYSSNYDFICRKLLKASPTIIKRRGETALKKMIFYNKKDVLDTEAILTKVLPHIKLKYNAAVNQEGKGCITCGSLNLKASRTIIKGKIKYQLFDCLDHGGYGGKCTWYYKKGSHHKTYGKMV